MIGSLTGQRRPHDVGTRDGEVATVKDLVERQHRPKCRERTKLCGRSGDLVEAMLRQDVGIESVAPIVAVAGDQGRELGTLIYRRMLQQAVGLPVAFGPHEAEV